ncbi:LTA synthase family protein [Bifidobacterium aemilianum]|nr:LTA synthase family protein [Bifidobacterium aemilianum]
MTTSTAVEGMGEPKDEPERLDAQSADNGLDHGDSDGLAKGTVCARKPFASWLYALLFLVFDIIAVLTLQWGVTQNSTRVELSSPLTGVWDMVAKMWTKQNFVFVLNLLLLGLIYAMLLFLINRFWVVSPLLLSAAAIVALIEHFKVSVRYETVLPSDVKLFGSNTGNIMSFLPSGAFWLIAGVLLYVAVLIGIFVYLNHIDGRHGRLIRPMDRTGLAAAVRLLLLALSVTVFGAFTAQVSTVGSWADGLSKSMGDIPSMWDSVYDAQRNGPLVSFIRQCNPKIMDKPQDYSQESMKALAKRYQSEAKNINTGRTTEMKDNTVVYILSESYSDPNRVPGVEINKDPMPRIRSIKDQTTSGYMLSSGYGGGTANLEYMSLTGLSMANFDSSLTSPYQQLVPGEQWTPTINQLWGQVGNSLAFHPYEPSMYSRAQDYKKFGISHFYTLEEPDVIAHQQKLGSSPYVSDEATYQSAFEKISATSKSQFIQMATMQNHMPYHSWYANNEFKASNKPGSPKLEADEKTSIDTYAKGVELTDRATKQFLDQLDGLSKPVTVVFYGDHLPGIYSTAGADSNNSLDLHLTDYFIWSNKASASRGQRNENSDYTSPNYFAAQTAEHMGAKVSPYLAFLTRMHDAIPAMEPPVVNNIQGWDRIPEGQPNYLDAHGKPMAAKDFDARTNQLMDDYKLIQYDITAGKGYLKDLHFMEVGR